MTPTPAPRPDPSTRDAVTARIFTHARRNWPHTKVLVRHHGLFCYVAVDHGQDKPFTVLRLRYQGSADRWLIGIYKASTETFSENELPTTSGPTIATPEEGMDHTLGFWIAPPARRPASLTERYRRLFLRS